MPKLASAAVSTAHNVSPAAAAGGGMTGDYLEYIRGCRRSRRPSRRAASPSATNVARSSLLSARPARNPSGGAGKGKCHLFRIGYDGVRGGSRVPRHPTTRSASGRVRHARRPERRSRRRIGPSSTARPAAGSTSTSAGSSGLASRGGALAVRGKDVLLESATGWPIARARMPLATDSVYNLGSITKQFTAAAILTLEMQGKLAVSDLASKYLDGVPADKAAITLHHLLTHSSGLESDFSPTDYDPVGREEYVRRALQSTLLFKPGDGYEYSNAGYSLLAAIVEKVSGQAYEAYLTERVLKPAGMLRDRLQGSSWALRRDRARLSGRARTGAPSCSGFSRRTRRTGCCAATAGCTRRLATCWRGIARSGPKPCFRRRRGRSTSSRTWPRAPPGLVLRVRLGRQQDAARHHRRAAQRRERHLRGGVHAVSGRGRDAVPHVDRRGMKATPVVEVLERIVFGGKAALPPPWWSWRRRACSALAGRVALPAGRHTDARGRWAGAGGRARGSGGVLGPRPARRRRRRGDGRS